MRFFLTFCFSFFIFSAPVLAQGHEAFCQQADSTAASQACIKRHLDSAQRRLNKIYQKLNAELKDEKLEELKELQKTWLLYRDAECMWESGRVMTPAVRRIHELSCMARVTEDRADLLMVAYADGEAEGLRQEYGSFPRWMNVLAKDYPDVFWNYGRRSSFDLDCDGEDEYIMQGIKTVVQKSDKSEKDEEEDQNLKKGFAKEVVVAIVQNPPTGRPKPKIFDFSVTEDDSSDSVCSDAITVEFLQKPEIKAEPNEDRR